ncbi:M3 family metallopeptidase [Pseudomonas mucidolens]|uniref:Oligopeptidase A n=1 Tax=Pseudomonas mucidolens TaxID=46679 RepID=A0A1H2NSP6_9PSED|nr:M3 family metallopeptidase [Pseudomonas mucidolens]SDV08414.1 oligopeptidase A [Pseudomonas mucidolens]SQH31144.1 oligopeptidase A [Pseudomonas mucidolens]
MPVQNPLLQTFDLPPFSQVRTEHLAPAAEALIVESRRQVAHIIQTQTPFPTWDDLVLALDDILARLELAQGVVTVLDASEVDEGWERAASDFHGRLNDFRAELMGNPQLSALCTQLAASPIAALFDAQRRRILGKIQVQFRRSGLSLPQVERERLAYLRLANELLEGEFSNRLAQATAAWSKHVEDEALLQGVPASLKQAMTAKAQAKGLPGWLITLDSEMFRGIMANAENRALRQEVCEAFFSRASDVGPHAGLYDNTDHLLTVLDGRHEIARLLGYEHFVQVVLEEQMVDSVDQVQRFFQAQLASEQSTFASDRRQLQAFAANHGVHDLQLWDYAFFSERLRQQMTGISAEQIREYFTLDHTLVRVCELFQRLFAVQFVERTDFDTWAAPVRLFEVKEYDAVIGYVFFEPFAGTSNEQGPNTIELRARHRDAEGLLNRPIAVMQCNFLQDMPGQPYLLDHLRLRILLHEFGHCLQHILTTADNRRLSGMASYGRDTAEFIGEFFELWCFQPQILVWLSRHYQTGAPLPSDLAQKQLTYLSTQTSWDTAELLTDAIFDFEVHRTWGDGRSIRQVFAEAVARVGQLEGLSRLRPANQLTHIMQGYAASLYSYRWSGVLAKEAFQRFLREGLFNPNTGRAFRHAVLAPGNSRSLLDALQVFLGTRPAALGPAPQ